MRRLQCFAEIVSRLATWPVGTVQSGIGNASAVQVEQRTRLARAPKRSAELCAQNVDGVDRGAPAQEFGRRVQAEAHAAPSSTSSLSIAPSTVVSDDVRAVHAQWFARGRLAARFARSRSRISASASQAAHVHVARDATPRTRRRRVRVWPIATPCRRRAGCDRRSRSSGAHAAELDQCLPTSVRGRASLRVMTSVPANALLASPTARRSCLGGRLRSRRAARRDAFAAACDADVVEVDRVRDAQRHRALEPDEYVLQRALPSSVSVIGVALADRQVYVRQIRLADDGRRRARVEALRGCSCRSARVFSSAAAARSGLQAACTRLGSGVRTGVVLVAVTAGVEPGSPRSGGASSGQRSASVLQSAKLIWHRGAPAGPLRVRASAPPHRTTAASVRRQRRMRRFSMRRSTSARPTPSQPVTQHSASRRTASIATCVIAARARFRAVPARSCNPVQPHPEHAEHDAAVLFVLASRSCPARRTPSRPRRRCAGAPDRPRAPPASRTRAARGDSTARGCTRRRRGCRRSPGSRSARARAACASSRATSCSIAVPTGCSTSESNSNSTGASSSTRDGSLGNVRSIRSIRCVDGSTGARRARAPAAAARARGGFARAAPARCASADS